MSLQSPANPSPFPSPSSSFLTPPTPSAHEFAVKPPLQLPPSTPAPRPRLNLINRGSRPLSTASNTSTTSVASPASAFDHNLFSARPAPPSPGAGSNPSLSRKPSVRSKAGSLPVSRANSLRNHRISLRPSQGNGTSSDSTLGGRGEGAATTHNHRVSAGSRLSLTFSSSLASPSEALFDMGISPSSPVTQDTSATSIATLSSEGSSGSTSTVSTSTSVSTTDSAVQPSSSPHVEHKVLVKIRDFAFNPTDERYNGHGPLVPKVNRVGRMNRRLGGKSNSTSSISSSDVDGLEEEEDDEADSWGWNGGGYGTRGFGFGRGWGARLSWAMKSGSGAVTAATIFDQEKAYAAAAANLSAASKTDGKANESAEEGSYPSRSDMDRNFLDSESEYFDANEDGDGLFEDISPEGDDEDEPLYPGLYRALYPFEPEGTAEMRLVEDQIVTVVGRGGGVGWAVVVAEPDGDVEPIDDEGALKAARHALVPESYLEPYKLDWELDEGGTTTN